MHYYQAFCKCDSNFLCGVQSVGLYDSDNIKYRSHESEIGSSFVISYNLNVDSDVLTKVLHEIHISFSNVTNKLIGDSIQMSAFQPNCENI